MKTSNKTTEKRGYWGQEVNQIAKDVASKVDFNNIVKAGASENKATMRNCLPDLQQLRKDIKKAGDKLWQAK